MLIKEWNAGNLVNTKNVATSNLEDSIVRAMTTNVLITSENYEFKEIGNATCGQAPAEPIVVEAEPIDAPFITTVDTSATSAAVRKTKSTKAGKSKIASVKKVKRVRRKIIRKVVISDFSSPKYDPTDSTEYGTFANGKQRNSFRI